MMPDGPGATNSALSRVRFKSDKKESLLSKKTSGVRGVL